jgi:nucleotide-binding universal stress UspA family protein
MGSGIIPHGAARWFCGSPGAWSVTSWLRMTAATTFGRHRAITVVHATALTPEDEVPRQHAVAIVAAAGGRLYSVHATDVLEPTAEIPDAIEVLRGWARARGTTTAELASVQYQRLVERSADDPNATLLRTIADLQPDLVVAGTRARTGIDLAIMGSTAQTLARHAHVPVLLLPVGHPGFVDPQTGALRLRKILVPMGDPRAAQTAIDAAVRLAELAEHKGELVLVHVGDEADAPAVTLHGGLGWGRRWVQAHGGVVDEVVERAEAERADLLVMASRGRDSLLDSLLGSHTERVLRRSPCPVLTVPVEPEPPGLTHDVLPIPVGAG